MAYTDDIVTAKAHSEDQYREWSGDLGLQSDDTSHSNTATDWTFIARYGCSLFRLDVFEMIPSLAKPFVTIRVVSMNHQVIRCQFEIYGTQVKYQKMKLRNLNLPLKAEHCPHILQAQAY
jgi:hypothetical protein